MDVMDRHEPTPCEQYEETIRTWVEWAEGKRTLVEQPPLPFPRRARTRRPKPSRKTLAA